MTMQDVMQYCKNYFADTENTISGQITIENGKIKTNILKNHRFCLIKGSHLNDGVYETDTESLRDEVFTGTVTPLCPPPDFIALVEKMQAWDTKYAEAMRRPFQSENFDGYSYSMKQGTNGAADWRTIWSGELNRYRKI